MKRFFKSSLSIFLALTIIFSSAYVGLSEVDFSKIKFNGFNFSRVSQFIKELTPGFSVKSQAATIDSLQFEFDSDSVGYIVSGCSEYAKGILIIPDTYNGKPVIGIGDEAFYKCQSLTSITIPDSVTSIGPGAFRDCYGLKSIKIPDGVTRIGSAAFYDCLNLTSITFSNNLKFIGSSAFCGYGKIESVYIPDIETWCNIKFGNSESNPLHEGAKLYVNGKLTTEIVFPETVTHIPSLAFYNCESLTSITIPDSVTSIGKDAFTNTGFYNDENNWDNGVLYISDCLIVAKSGVLSSEYIVNSETKIISASAFSNCDNLKSIVIGNRVKIINERTFADCDNLTSITIPDSVTKIEGEAFWGCTSLTSVVIPDSVTSIGTWAFRDCTNLTSITIPDSVTIIGDEAFYYCESLTSITIPNSVTSIGKRAFWYCTSLEKIFWNVKAVEDLTKTFNVFYNAGTSGSGIEVVFGNSVEKIPAYLFAVSDSSYNPKLKSVVISDSITSIGEDAFVYCSVDELYITNLESWCNIDFASDDSAPGGEDIYINGELATDIVIPDSVMSIGNYAFTKCAGLTSVIIPNSVTSIGAWAFRDCTNLTSITIPDSVTLIGESAFENCTNLKSITIPDSVRSIGKYTFWNCTSLKSITIPDSVTSIGYAAFLDCENLESVTIPDSVTSIDKMAFYRCPNLNVINITDIAAWCKIDFYSYVLYGEDSCNNPLFYAKNLYLNGELVTDLDIPNNVTSIGDYAFCYCENIESVTIPDSVTLIGENAFENCTGLTAITIPDSVTSICEDAFTNTGFYNDENNWDNGVLYIGNHLIAAYEYDSGYIGNIGGSYTIKDGTKNIAIHALSGCDTLTSITIPDSVTNIGENAFYYCWSLEYVFYEGTQEQWSKISIDLSNSKLLKAKIHYESTDHTISDWIIEKDATCTADGKKNKVCIGCGKVFETEVIVSTGHNYSDEWTIDKKSTCTEVGSKSHHCINCNAKKDVTSMPALGHDYETEWTIDMSATCTDKGSKSHHCTRCDSKADVTDITATGHNESSWITDKEATLNAAGLKHSECTECGEVLETAEIPQLKCAKPTLKSIENTAYGVKITWGKVSGSDKYYVYRKTSGGSYSKIGTTTKTYYTDKKAKSGKKYYYVVKAVNEAGSSSSSSSKSIVYLADPTLKTPKSTKKGVTLNWSKVTGAQGYVIYYKTGSGSYKKLTTVKGNSKVKYTHTKAKKGKTYTYKVKAYYSKTYSAYSDAKKIKDKY